MQGRRGHRGRTKRRRSSVHDALRDALPHLIDWFDGTPAFLYSHPSGPRIMDTLTDGTGTAPSLLDLSRQSLAELGNNASASVLDVLRHAFDHPIATTAPARSSRSALASPSRPAKRSGSPDHARMAVVTVESLADTGPALSVGTPT